MIPFLLISISLFRSVFGADSGEVVSVLGRVEVLRSGGWQAVRAGEVLAAGAVVRTAEGGRVALQLANGAQIKLNANCQLELREIAQKAGLKPTAAGAADTAAQNLLRVLKGEIWVRSDGVPLEIQSMPVVATIRGTEFAFAVDAGQVARLAVVEGEVEFHNPQGRVTVAAREQASARLGEAPRKGVLLDPLDAVQWSLYYPDLAGERARPGARATAPDWIERARAHLSRGEVPDARRALDRAVALDPRDARAYSLRAVIELVQNRKAEARAEAERAVATDPRSPVAHLSLSWVRQAEFDLDGALASAREAVAADPENAQALIQESRLLFGMGHTTPALKAAERARQRAPDDALVNSTWGFLQLAKGRTEAARRAFQTAIQQDSTLGEPRLGLGLALFRQNRTGEAVKEIEKATLLEPKVSLYHSYLGKAYDEIKDERRAEKALARAKRLDPRDPTPHFYDALRLQAAHGPIEAVQSLQRSIELNDHRAVYRSRLLLDEDAATRGISLARAYTELGFDQVAKLEAAKSLSLDPANHSAHRFLSDSYLAQPRHEIARVSELLQAQLLQSTNINPIYPSLAAKNLNILIPMDLSRIAFSEYMTLFRSDQTQIYASGLIGNQGIWSDEVVLSGIYGPFSYSLGQLHYQTQGFRPNSDVQHDLSNLFVQTEITPELNLQAEYRYRKSSQGDVQLNLDGTFNSQDRNHLSETTSRIGIRYSPSLPNNFISSFVLADRSKTINYFNDNEEFEILDDIESQQSEIQWLYKANLFNAITGFSVYSNKTKTYYLNELYSEFPSSQKTAYFYINYQLSENIVGTFGLSYDIYKLQNFNLESLSPKFGLGWNISDRVILRAAAFEVVKRDLASNQTIEPTQISGFNQFFDDANGTNSKNYAIGLDAHPFKSLFGGFSFTRRDLDMPFGIGGPFEIEKDREHLYHAYLYWLPAENWSVALEYLHEEFEMLDGTFRRTSFPTRLRTATVPLNVHYFNSSGFFAGIGATYVHQLVKYDSEATSLVGDTSDFALFDAVIGYRLPKRWGLLSLEVKNIFDEKFQFQDYSFQTASDSNDPRFLPERTILARLTFNFE